MSAVATAMPSSGGSLSQETLLGPRCHYTCILLKCHYMHQKRHPAQKTWLSIRVQFKCSIVTSFKQTILPLSTFFSKRSINEGLMMHCTIYNLNEGFEPTNTKCYCNHSKEALTIKHTINHPSCSLLQGLLERALWRQSDTLERPLFKWNYWWQLNTTTHYLLPLLQFFSNLIFTEQEGELKMFFLNAFQMLSTTIFGKKTLRNWLFRISWNLVLVCFLFLYTFCHKGSLSL